MTLSHVLKRALLSIPIPKASNAFLSKKPKKAFGVSEVTRCATLSIPQFRSWGTNGAVEDTRDATV